MNEMTQPQEPSRETETPIQPDNSDKLKTSSS